MPSMLSCMYSSKGKHSYRSWEPHRMSCLINSLSCLSHLSPSSWCYFTPGNPLEFLVPLFQMTAFLWISIFSHFLNVIWISTVSLPHYLAISPSTKRSLSLSLLIRLNVSVLSESLATANVTLQAERCRCILNPAEMCHDLAVQVGTSPLLVTSAPAGIVSGKRAPKAICVRNLHWHRVCVGCR